MWRRLLDVLACPTCAGNLSLETLEDTNTPPIRSQSPASVSDPKTWIDWGLLLCERCRTMYPIADGLPVMLRYATPAAGVVAERFGSRLQKLGGLSFPEGKPVPGEEFVLRSFSREWTEYEYDGVMWDLSYEDHEKRFLAECWNDAIDRARGGLFVEIGCGLGMSTVFGQKHTGGHAIGFDLGHAAGRAAGEFKTNDRLHFVQASAFSLPLRPGSADLVYSHGVLHHTYPTEEAVRAVAPIVKPGGSFYLWLYGPESQKGSPLRRLAWTAEAAIRPWIGRNLDHPLSNGFLRTAALGYLVVNRFHRARDGTVRGYTLQRALHAARDRFTPLFAHRHDYAEVSRWFGQAGFDDIEQVDWRTMPTANQDNYRRNTGIRGRGPL